MSRNQGIIDTANQARAAIDQAYMVADKAWEDARKTVADLANMYGIDPRGLFISSDVGWETRLAVRNSSGYVDLHEDPDVSDCFTADANYLLDNSMFYGFFQRDADENGNVYLIPRKEGM